MPALDKTRPAPASLFSRELELRLKEQQENEDCLLWVVNTDYGQTLKMLGEEHPAFWKAGTVIHLEWVQWMAINKGGALHWMATYGKTITHEQMMERASVVWPEDRRIISWLEDH